MRPARRPTRKAPSKRSWHSGARCGPGESLAEALRALHQAEAESKEGSARHLVGWCMTELGIGLEAAGQQDDAKKVLTEAAKLLRTTGKNDRGASRRSTSPACRRCPAV